MQYTLATPEVDLGSYQNMPKNIFRIGVICMLNRLGITAAAKIELFQSFNQRKTSLFQRIYSTILALPVEALRTTPLCACVIPPF
jgi:hypothetical protein